MDLSAVGIPVVYVGFDDEIAEEVRRANEDQNERAWQDAKLWEGQTRHRIRRQARDLRSPPLTRAQRGHPGRERFRDSHKATFP